MESDLITKAQYAHAVRQEVQWLLKKDNKDIPKNKEENDARFRAGLEKSLKETGAYGQLVQECEEDLEPAIKVITFMMQKLIMEVVNMEGPMKWALEELENAATKIIDES